MATVTKAANTAADGNANATTDLGQWASESNAFSTTGDNTYAAAALDTTKNSGRASRFGFPAFGTGDIPDGATINSVTVTVEWMFTPAATGALLGVQIENPSGTPLGSETTYTTVTTEVQRTQQVTSGVTLTDLRSANVVVANVRFRKGNVTTTTTGSLDFVSLTVDYTASTAHTAEPADTLALADGVGLGPGKVLASTLSLADSAARALVYARAQDDTLALADLADPQLSSGAEVVVREIALVL